MAKKKTTKSTKKKTVTKKVTKKAVKKTSPAAKKKTAAAPKKKAAAKKSAAPKKNKDWAVQAMSEWIAHPMEFGRPPAECEVVYEKNIPWSSGKEKVFLVRYKMDDGFETIGFTGLTTWSFMGIPLSEIEKLQKRFVMRRLLNLYIGWYYTFFAYHDDDYAKKYAPKTMNAKEIEQALARELTEEIGINRDYAVKNKEGLGSTWSMHVPAKICRFTCTGEPDSIYLDKKYHYTVPVRLSVDLDQLNKPEYSGIVELEFILAFKADAKTAGKVIKTRSTRYFAPTWPVYAKIPLYHYIGTLYGPVIFERHGNPYFYDH